MNDKPRRGGADFDLSLWTLFIVHPPSDVSIVICENSSYEGAPMYNTQRQNSTLPSVSADLEARQMLAGLFIVMLASLKQSLTRLRLRPTRRVVVVAPIAGS